MDKKEPSSAKLAEITFSLRLSRRRLVTIVVVIAITAAVIAMMLVRTSSEPNIFSKDFTKSVDFPLYYPADLPKGLTVNKTSVIKGEGVVTYSIASSKGNALAVSEQAIPNKFNFDKFYKENIELPQHVNTPEGKLTTGKLNGLSVCMLVTDKTWVIVNDAAGSAEGKLPSICRGLRPVAKQ